MFNDFKPVLKILLRFLLIYLMLLFAYQFYLNMEKDGLDSFSKWVGEQTTFVQNFLGYPSKMTEIPERETSWFSVKGQYISRMVEGCNAISVMILFSAFVFAFYKGKKTFVFAAAGWVFLHMVNVLRIAGLNILLVEMPQYSKAGHDYIFPAVIYGSVVALWLIWINFFALKVSKK
ncbi:MAG: exosortase family protein XrtF [Kaistella sp.]|nr:exosortase family protein XrtF [Kaistella sp.]